MIRRKGAEGNLPLPLEDRIEILATLATGPEANLRKKALETLSAWDWAQIRRIMDDPRTTPAVAAALAALPHSSHPEPAPSELTPEAVNEAASKLAPGTTKVTAADKAGVELLAELAASTRADDVETPPEVTKRDDELTPQERETLIQKVGRMTVVEKIKAALTGNLETRSLLIRDSNKIISRAVLQSPKVSDTEAESYAAAKNVSDEVLRLISMNRRFMKNYVVMRALANNPRAPLDVTMPLITRLKAQDLKGISLNRNVPDVLRSMANKLIRQKEELSRPKVYGKS
ncbi:MAG: hypothetical protein ACLQVL_35320 [Terriglobia bacterium]